MSWDDDFEPSPSPSPNKGKPKKQKEKGNVYSSYASSGGLCVSQTIAAFLATTAVSFAVAYLTRNMPTRPFWVLALVFAAPVIALMASTLLVEHATGAMTPPCSRGAQVGLAAACAALALITGSLCQFTNTEAKKPQVITTSGWTDTVILLDKSGSMYGWEDTQAKNSVQELLDSMDSSVSVGAVIYNGTAVDVPMAPLDEGQKTRIMNLVSTEPDGGTSFGTAVSRGLSSVSNFLGGKQPSGKINMIMITDGMPGDNFMASSYIDRCNDLGVTVSYIRIGTTSDSEMEKLTAQTGGTSVDVANASTLGGEMKTIVGKSSQTVIEHDALRNISLSNNAKIVVGILLTLMGLLIGFSLTIMFSTQGQKRVQLVLSPVMGLAAFALMAFGQPLIPTDWIREAVAFSLLGLVFMRKNTQFVSTAPKATSTAADDSDW